MALMERYDAVRRPVGPRSGWVVLDEADRALIAALRRAQRDLGGPVSSLRLAGDLGKSRRTVRQRLAWLERMHVVVRHVHHTWLYVDGFEEAILAVLRHYGPAASPEVAERLGRPARTVRRYLRRMEAMGMICRPLGPKRGWMLTRSHEDAVMRRLREYGPISVPRIARLTGLRQSMVRRRVELLEARGVVWRPDERGYRLRVWP